MIAETRKEVDRLTVKTGGSDFTTNTEPQRENDGPPLDRLIARQGKYWCTSDAREDSEIGNDDDFEAVLIIDQVMRSCS